jgi:hypothetical protein
MLGRRQRLGLRVRGRLVREMMRVLLHRGRLDDMHLRQLVGLVERIRGWRLVVVVVVGNVRVVMGVRVGVVGVRRRRLDRPRALDCGGGVFGSHDVARICPQVPVAIRDVICSVGAIRRRCLRCDASRWGWRVIAARRGGR